MKILQKTYRTRIKFIPEPSNNSYIVQYKNYSIIPWWSNVYEIITVDGCLSIDAKRFRLMKDAESFRQTTVNTSEKLNIYESKLFID